MCPRPGALMLECLRDASQGCIVLHAAAAAAALLLPSLLNKGPASRHITTQLLPTPEGASMVAGAPRSPPPPSRRGNPPPSLHRAQVEPQTSAVASTCPWSS